MSKTRPSYTPEFRRRMVELVRAGRDPAGLACEFEPSSIALAIRLRSSGQRRWPRGDPQLECAG